MDNVWFFKIWYGNIWNIVKLSISKVGGQLGSSKIGSIELSYILSSCLFLSFIHFIALFNIIPISCQFDNMKDILLAMLNVNHTPKLKLWQKYNDMIEWAALWPKLFTFCKNKNNKNKIGSINYTSCKIVSKLSISKIWQKCIISRPNLVMEFTKL